MASRPTSLTAVNVLARALLGLGEADPGAFAQYLFVTTGDQIEAGVHELPDATSLLYVAGGVRRRRGEARPSTRFPQVREAVEEREGFEERWSADLPSHLRRVAGDGAPHQYAAYVYDSTVALLRAIDGAISEGAYDGGTLDGEAVVADLRGRTMPDAWTGNWALDEFGDVVRPFEIVFCGPTPGRAAAGTTAPPLPPLLLPAPLACARRPCETKESP